MENEMGELKKFKKDFEDNLLIADKRLNKTEELLRRTEYDRLMLLNKNKELTEKIDRQNVIEKYIQEEAKKLYIKKTESRGRGDAIPLQKVRDAVERFINDVKNSDSCDFCHESSFNYDLIEDKIRIVFAEFLEEEKK